MTSGNRAIAIAGAGLAIYVGSVTYDHGWRTGLLTTFSAFIGFCLGRTMWHGRMLDRYQACSKLHDEALADRAAAREIFNKAMSAHVKALEDLETAKTMMREAANTIAKMKPVN